MNNITTLTTTTTAPFAIGDTITPISAMKGEPYIVLAFHLTREARDGMYAEWTVLCALPNNKYSPFASWVAFARPEGIHFETGMYSRDLTDAVRIYSQRTGARA